MKTLILSKREVEALLSMRECIELMRDALVSLARGEVLLPLRPVLKIPDSKNVYALMPVYSKTLGAIGTKFITVFPDNHGTEYDSHQGAVILIDGAHGNLKAIMDAASITAIRTAAVSAVATDLLARKDSAVLAILGSGVQARTHIDAMLAVRPFTKVLIWGRSADHARALVDRVRNGYRPRRNDGGSRQEQVAFEVVSSAEAAVQNADVVCTVTASREPVLRGAWLRPGTHINAVGASLPTARELDTDAVRRARLFVDRRESAVNEAGDLVIPISEGAVSAGGGHIVAEIGELLHDGRAGRQDAAEITLFKSLGLAVEDLACAHYLHERAQRDKAGTWVDL